MRTRRKGRWLPRQPRLGARMCQGTFFFMCTSGGVFVLTLQQIRKAIFPAVSLPENPAKKWKNRLTRQLKALILGEHALGEDFILMRGNCCKTAVLS